MPIKFTVFSGPHTCGHCNGKGKTGFWLWKKDCSACKGAGKIFVPPEQVVWPKEHERPRSPIRRDEAIDVEAVPPDARPYMHDRPRRPPRR